MVDMSRFLVLASSSPARLRVLRDAGIHPRVVPSGVPEDVEANDTATAVALLAERKARAVATICPGELVLGCDSLLDLDGRAFGKPASGAEAAEMWRAFAGRRATLHTGHFLIDGEAGREVGGVASTRVRFGKPAEEELRRYVSSGEPLALAGAFSIDGLGSPFVEGIDGDPGNVLGLSLPLLRSMLSEIAIAIVELWPAEAPPSVRRIDDDDAAFMLDLMQREWGLPVVSLSGAHDPTCLPGYVAVSDGRRLGALTWREDASGIEVVTLNSLYEGAGAGSALLEAAHRLALRRGRRLWLTTTDDHVEAVGFYLRRGMELVAVHRDFVDTVRRFKPAAGAGGAGGSYRHALELQFPHDPRPS